MRCFRQSLAPPLSNCGRFLPPVPWVHVKNALIFGNMKLSNFADTKCHFFAVNIVVYTALFHKFTCRRKACQVLIYWPVLGLTGENCKYNYSKAVHVYPLFSNITCSTKNYKIALVLQNRIGATNHACLWEQICMPNPKMLYMITAHIFPCGSITNAAKHFPEL